MSFISPESAYTAATYIFIAPTCRTNIISLEPYALNAEFQHFIPRFNKISSLYGYIEVRFEGQRRPQNNVTLWMTLVYTFTCPKIFTQGRVSVFDKYLHWPCVSVKKLYTCQQCKRNKFEHLRVNNLHFTWDLYAIYISLLTLTCTTLMVTIYPNN